MTEQNQPQVIQELSEVQKQEKKSQWSHFLLETLQTIVLAVVLYFLIDSVVARVRVENISMLPTLQPGEFVVVNKLAYRLGQPQRGDIVVFHMPINPEEDYIKRLIGLPGDVVKAEGGKVYVNGTLIQEPYLIENVDYTGEWTVPEKAYFVLGDNRVQSYDSHSWGFVPAENMVGKALFIYWPFNQFKILDHVDLMKTTQ